MGRDEWPGEGCRPRPYFNPLSPHGERPRWTRIFRPSTLISIHSPRMGRDLRQHVFGLPMRRFQSTLPAWGETPPKSSPFGGLTISIHSPRMGRDLPRPFPKKNSKDFNPLSPHGERHEGKQDLHGLRNFNPLSPHGERRYHGAGDAGVVVISIHSPRMGRDSR